MKVNTDRAYIVMALIALAVGLFAVYQQSALQAAEFRAHVAEELMERSQDALVNKEVSE
jgi:hypothetical protein